MKIQIEQLHGQAGIGCTAACVLFVKTPVKFHTVKNSRLKQAERP